MGNVLTQLIDFVLPPLCSVCKAPVDQAQKLCGDCWSKLHFIQDPCCVRCGYPFESASGTLCKFCMSAEPPFHKMRSVFSYGGLAKPLIMGFKHTDRTDLLPLITNWMRALYLATPELTSDIILPVPLHRLRLWKRKYNQAGLIAGELSRSLKIPVTYTLLSRTKYTVPQKGKRDERFQNIKNAFCVNKTELAILRGKTMLVIDDVVTTGATASACVDALLSAGAARVNVLSLARVVL